MRDITAQHGTEDRRDDVGDAVDGHRHAELPGGKGIDEDALLGWLEPAAAEPLKHSKEDQELDARGRATQGRTDCEQQHAGHVKTLAAKQPNQPARERQNDGVGRELRGQDPGRLAAADREAPGDVRQRDVGDRDVEHLHERRQRDGDRDDPVIDRRLDLGPVRTGVVVDG